MVRAINVQRECSIAHVAWMVGRELWQWVGQLSLWTIFPSDFYIGNSSSGSRLYPPCSVCMKQDKCMCWCIVSVCCCYEFPLSIEMSSVHIVWFILYGFVTGECRSRARQTRHWHQPVIIRFKILCGLDRQLYIGSRYFSFKSINFPTFLLVVLI